jgi:putative membrane protein insertion efficiency factor
MKKINSLIKKLMLFLIKTYQMTLSPRFSNGACRYYPTCSAYAAQAIETHGIIKGTFLAIRRIARCNPFSKGGYDPVPPKKNKESNRGKLNSVK